MILNGGATITGGDRKDIFQIALLEAGNNNRAGIKDFNRDKDKILFAKVIDGASEAESKVDLTTDGNDS